jgi:uncharacterized protein
VELTAEEGRVLGCLVEKQLTTPQLYPLTENALLTACNQTTARDPVVRYDVASVRMAVRGLREKELLRTVHRSGERSEKHQHQVEQVLELAPEQVALLAVLLLRGPQTPGELRARTERMHPFDSLEAVGRALDAMAHREPPLVTPLERQAGRKETRYAELLVGSGPAGTSPAPALPPPGALVGAGAPAPGVPLPAPAAAPTPAVAELAAQVEALRAELAALRAQVDALSAGS